MATRNKAAGYHGIQNMKFAQKSDSGYSTQLTDLLYAKSLNPSALLEAVEQYADNRLLFRIPSDTGYEGEIGTTAPDMEFEKLAGFAQEGANGLIRMSLASYVRGALYYEFIERDEAGLGSAVKVWLYNVEIGKGSETYTTDASSVEFGSYAYPFRAYGDDLMDQEGTTKYLDDKGLGRKAFMYMSRPGDTGYDTFGASVPVPKAAEPIV